MTLFLGCTGWTASSKACQWTSLWPLTHSQLDLTEPNSLHLKVWVRLSTSSLLVCILSGPFLCHFLTDGIFRGATQLGKVIFRLSIFSNTDGPQVTAYLDNETSPAASVSIWTAERSKDLLSWPCISEAQVCVGRQEGPTLSLVLMVYSPKELWTKAPHFCLLQLTKGMGATLLAFQGMDATHRSSQWSLLNRQEQKKLLLNEFC